jgi:hypothetical protein
MIQVYNTALARSTNFHYSSVSPSRSQPGSSKACCLGPWGATSSELALQCYLITRLASLSLFCMIENWFLIDPLHYLSSRPDFGFKLAETFVIKNRLPDSPSRGFNNSLNHRVGELAFECLKENSASRRVVDSPSRGVAMVSRGVAIQILKIFKSL